MNLSEKIKKGHPEVAADLAPSRVPFQPAQPPVRGSLFDRSGCCPACGSTSIRAADHGIHEAWVVRLSVSVDIRCSSCNASFRRFAPLRGMGAAALASIALILLTYGAFWLVRHAPFSRPETPSMRRDRAPKPAPPVFHEMKAASRLRDE